MRVFILSYIYGSSWSSQAKELHVTAIINELQKYNYSATPLSQMNSHTVSHSAKVRSKAILMPSV